MQRTSLDELPKYSPWITRLVGIEPFSKRPRDLKRIDAEYDKDKYAKLLAYYQEEPSVGIHEMKSRETSSCSPTLCISIGAELFLTSPSEYQRVRDAIVIDTLAEAMSDVKVVVELGCGYGYNLAILRDAYPGRVWIGGEYSQKAIKLADCLFADYSDISVFQFNWYDDVWSIFEQFEGKALVFTCHSIEQLPTSRTVLRTFDRYKAKTAGVVCLEPVFELADPMSTLGLMRRRYAMLNDYNTDLLTCVTDMGVHIIRLQYDLIGGNPLNPTSLIHWTWV